MDKTAAKIIAQLEAVDPCIASLPPRTKDLIGVAFVHAYTLGVQGTCEVFGTSPGVPPDVRTTIVNFARGALEHFKSVVPPYARGLF